MPARTPTGARADARRLMIAKAALAVVADHPVADVQLAEIAARAGMKPNHVLYYFASRDAVLIEAVRHAELQLAGARAAALGDRRGSRRSASAATSPRTCPTTATTPSGSCGWRAGCARPRTRRSVPWGAR